MKTAAAIQSFLQSREALNRSPRTIEWYRHKLYSFARSYPKLPKAPRQIDEFLIDIKGEENTHGHYRALKAFYRFLKKRYQLTNPIELIELRRPIRTDKPTLEPDELLRLLYSASTLRDRTLLTLLMDTGIRASELAGLKKWNILTEEVKVLGKTGWRTVPISEETRRMLLALVSQNGSDDHVFHGQRGPLSRRGVYTIVSKYMRKVGIDKPKHGSHRIRHAFAKTYLMNGGDTSSLQQIMGHASITTTEEYLKYANKDSIRKHHMFTLLLAMHAAAQESFFDTSLAIKEAEEILERSSQ